MTRLCIIRDLNGTMTTAPMACAHIINVAQSGQWGEDWALEECVENPHGSAPILVERMTHQAGKLVAHTDEAFFLEHFDGD